MRLYSIMNDFVSESDYITLDFFVKKYGVSKRTIQNDLSYLIQLSKDKGFYINFRRGYGYILEVNDSKKLKRFMDSLNSDGNMTNSQRIQAIGFYLVMSDAYVTMDQLAEEFNVSIATIKKEVKQAENLLMDFGLALERRRHYGLHILCDDDKARDYVLSAYTEGNPYIMHSIHEDLRDFSKIYSFLISQIEKNNFNINYAELKVVISQLEVITFYAMHKELSEYIVLKTNSENVIHEISQNIKELIEGYYLVSLDKKCFELIQKVLLKNVRTKKSGIVFGNQLESDINDFLIEIDELYNTQFQKDESFKKSLITHVSLLIERLLKKISYQNLLIKEICARYPMIFNISIRFSEMLKTKYGVEVSQDEAGFIATHFAAHMEKERQMKMDRFTKIAVVCSSGGGSAYLIKMQIESLFKQANVETFSFTNMEGLENFQPDLIFTILPLEKEFSVPVIYIKELLDDLDLMQIKQVLQYENCDSFDLTETNNYLYSIFNKEFFQYKDESDYLKLIEEMATQIEMSGYGGEHYKKYVLQRENYMNTIYLNGICIAHPIELCANKNVVSVTVLKNPIVYQGKEARIVFMVSLRKEDTYIHKRITEKLFQLMKSEKQIQNILQHHTFEDLIVTLKEIDGGVFLMTDFLKRLSNADAIAGREKEVRTLLRNEMKDYSDEIRYDHLGSICFKSSGTEENPVKIMFSAHMDEVGFFVRHISDNGFIYLIAVGGVLDKSKEMQKVRVTTESGKKIPGILNVTKVDGKVKDMYVDVGCETGQEILDLGVQIGDMVTFASESYEMAQPKVICGKAMDDRTGCYVISNAIKKIHEIKHKSEVWMVASSSEEVGTRGGKTTTELIDADIVVAVDVANNPELVKNFTNHRLLSKGCMILHYDKTMVPNEKFLRYVKKLAKEHNVLFQEDMFSGGGTDCANAHLVNTGKIALVIGIPLRYCHAAWSLVHEDDLNNAISLVTEIATSIGKKEYESFIDFEED